MAKNKQAAANKPSPPVDVGPQDQPQAADASPMQSGQQQSVQDQSQSPVVASGLGGAAGGYLGMAIGTAIAPGIGGFVGASVGSTLGSAAGQAISDVMGGDRAAGAGTVSSLDQAAVRQLGTQSDTSRQTRYLQTMADGIGTIIAQGIKTKGTTNPGGSTV